MWALSIQQPYAELIVRGIKRVENRTWWAKHRGPLLIHAARSRERLGDYDYKADGIAKADMAFGAIIGVVNLGSIFEKRLVNAVVTDHPRLRWLLNDPHVEGPRLWLLDTPRKFIEPIKWPGERQLFYVPDEVVREAVEAVEAAEAPAVE